MPRNNIKPKKVSWSPSVANFAAASSGPKAQTKLNVWRGSGVEHKTYIGPKQCKHR